MAKDYRHLRYLAMQAVEPRYCLSAVTFVESQIACCSLDEQPARWIDVGDLDGDGDLDIVWSTSYEGGIYWYENAGHGVFRLHHVISSTNDLGPLAATDIDGDGDLDVVSSAGGYYREVGSIGWYENLDGAGSFSTRRTIADAIDSAHSIAVSDLDGDGDIDVASTSGLYTSTVLSWHENVDGSGRFREPIAISSRESARWGVDIADVNDDGHPDIVSGASASGVAWHENDGGRFVDEHPIGQFETHDVSAVSAADLDRDGDVDVLVGSGGTLVWFENTDGQGRFGAQHEIVSEEGGGNWFVSTADFDGDGDLDVLSGKYGLHDMGPIAWFENSDGRGNFQEAKRWFVEGPSHYAARPADVDGDGDVDVLVAVGRQGIAFLENVDGHGPFEGMILIHHTAVSAQSVHAADVDGDGDLDVLSAVYDSIAWYENSNGEGAFGARKVISSSVYRATSVSSADIDGDGDLDVLSSSSGDHKIAWYMNIDGEGQFGQQQLIDSSANNATSVMAADLDADGDLDVIATGDATTWYENIDGAGSFGDARRLTPTQSSFAFASDLDGDGRLDILLSSSDYVSWLKNDGQTRFGGRRRISRTSGDASAIAADLDGDGDLDVITDRRTLIVWFPNTDGLGNFEERIISLKGHVGLRSVGAADVDGDGDLDVLAASYSDWKVAWFENTDGLGTFGAQQLITTDAKGATSIFMADINGDGDIDVLSSSAFDGKIAWYENRLLGDSNDDGAFNSNDFIMALASGKYEDDTEATFDEGDWNQDGKFTSDDLVDALAAGHYVAR